MSNVSVKNKLITYLASDSKYNTFTARQAQARFKIKNVRARIAELRQEGFAIYTNRKTLEDGRRISYYRLGKPSKRYLRRLATGHRKLAIQALYA